MSLRESNELALSQQYRLTATLESLQLTSQAIEESGIGGELWQQNQLKVQEALQILENAVDLYIKEFSLSLEKRSQFWEGCTLGKSHNRVLHRSQPPAYLLQVLQGKGDPNNPLHVGILVGYRFAYLKRFLSRFELPEEWDVDLAAATFG
ncbi:MAG TPA: hypothetical protein DDZ80_06025 [Cyanobacteria bacterium UBA8803]|nr:hypothetical protein [Cyanobacteria bacterium UBA9273]HBL58092.1 hypothetical protein [Cyanobacteria bacterium UBA8803]